jgi:hypothetical protein
MSFGSPPPVPQLPAAPPPAPAYGLQPVGSKPGPKVSQRTSIPGVMFPGPGQTQMATLLGSATGGKSLLGA